MKCHIGKVVGKEIGKKIGRDMTRWLGGGML